MRMMQGRDHLAKYGRIIVIIVLGLGNAQARAAGGSVGGNFVGQRSDCNNGNNNHVL